MSMLHAHCLPACPHCGDAFYNIKNIKQVMYSRAAPLPTPGSEPVPAGFGAAKHLTEQGYDVTLLDASPNPGGLSTGWRTSQGRAVEAGVKGFWYQVSHMAGLWRRE